MRLSSNFNSNEFKCKCCGQLPNTKEFHEEFIDRLQAARTIAGIRFDINSGYRCQNHNRAVGGAANSAHLKGLAADIEAKTDESRFKIIVALLSAGFTRIGIAKTYIHADIDGDKNPQRMWLY